ncbi:MAG: methylenetetrahydrofolate reductase, partial [Alphaproteobacteria bacterium]
YAVMCGVGPSLRALKERQALAKAVATGETPEELLLDVMAAFKLNPALGLDGVHFFTFGSLENSVRFAQRLR